jgi:hypothetical protein
MGRYFEVTNFLIMSSEGRAEGLACADPGARTHIGISKTFTKHLQFTCWLNMLTKNILSDFDDFNLCLSYLYIYLYIYTFIYLYIYTFIYLSIYTFIYLFIYTVIHLFIYTFIHLYIYLFIHLYILIYKVNRNFNLLTFYNPQKLETWKGSPTL